MLPDTITTTTGVGNDSTVYSLAKRNGNEVVYVAPSPQGDLLGSPELRFASQITKGGVARTLVQFKTPIYDATLGKYTGFLTTDLVVKRPTVADIADVEIELEKISELGSTVFAAVASNKL